MLIEEDASQLCTSPRNTTTTNVSCIYVYFVSRFRIFTRILINLVRDAPYSTYIFVFPPSNPELIHLVSPRSPRNPCPRLFALFIILRTLTKGICISLSKFDRCVVRIEKKHRKALTFSFFKSRFFLIELKSVSVYSRS